MEHDAPTQVGADADWATLSVKDRTICVIKMNGALFCRGEWSDGTANPSPTLTRIGGPAVNWKAISVGSEICGVRGDGTLWCWGNANGSPLGDGNTGIADPILGVPSTAVPTQIGTDTDWASVSTRGFTSCATKADGSLWCWGFSAAITPQIKTVPAAIN
ncbi:MAG TPA: hypothetical protein VK601_25745 [Kofleriaceae bacterium]|nr:hypothetical protein [Kofleriaceae bacterium]